LSDVGFKVIVMRRMLLEITGGDAVRKTPPVVVSRSAVSHAGKTVLVVAVATGTTCALATAVKVSAVWAENAIEAVIGIESCQLNSRHAGRCPLAHVETKSCVKVTGL
jgi:mRNA-degrading endonuclease toxin of MazEF toxin-antitoxin module